MKCPNCTSKKMSISPTPGFTPSESPSKECLECGHLWCVKDGKVQLIRQGVIGGQQILKIAA
jgi:hypothetical protein